ncbi:TIGR00341 family protein [Methanothermococcus okinawensis]|uniref:TIGR00341 family protein n=1 Tax=Methanothermococcus okinawensis (strain DSM 14208 / JCM 11175 / IH1) TaxID=647113 RepID=F8ALC7_METOI|nr:TIGR00341 family protein [Methanothermococcus okinawensis]AEH06515.1 Conserved hypothetical protein CHP00341 [Methanothermococcus okinawensis IH1]
MKLRYIECYIPKHIFSGTDKILEDCGDVVWYNVEEINSNVIIKILTTLKNTELILDKLNKEYGGSKFRIIVFEPKSTIPEIVEKIEKEEIEEKETTDKNLNVIKAPIKKNIQELERLSRQEIQDKVSEMIYAPKEYYLMLILSTIVAAIGIWKNDVALIIASMIIAPLLSPNISLSFSMVVADKQLAKKSLKNLLLGVGLVILLSVFLGHFLPLSLKNPQIVSRMNLGITDIIIALCAGIVGALSTVSGISSVVVGVMIAVALLPPLVAFGLTFGAGYFVESIPILVLFLINVICVNLASSVIFALYGISPYKWWKKEEAKKLTIFAILTWVILLIIAVILVYFGI